MFYEGSGTAAGSERYLEADERGSIVSARDASGNKLWIDSYDEYGIPAASNRERFQYTGQVWIADIGLYYFKARMYSPTLGRFMQTDPIGYADGINWYDYTGGDPVNWSDPSGLGGARPSHPNWNSGPELVVDGDPCRAAPGRCISGQYAQEATHDLQGRNDIDHGDRNARPDGSSPQNKQCGPTSMVPHGAGLSVGASADAGIPGVAGAGANGSAGGFYSGKVGFSAGAFASGGVAAYAGGHSASAVGGSRPAFAGASAGIGRSGFITNAQSVQQLSGPFTTYSLNVGVGPIQATISLSVGGGIYQLSVSPPGAGVSGGLSGSKLTTNTVATRGCH